MTLKDVLFVFGVQLEHIYDIKPDGSMLVMLTQCNGTKLPVSTRVGGSGNRVLPYLDTWMSFQRLSTDSREITTVTLTGGDFSDEYILYPKHLGKPIITKNGTII